MNGIIQKRVVPVSAVTLAAMVLLGLFQLFLLAGGLETDEAVVKRFAPWFYETYRQMIGEDHAVSPVEPVAAESGPKVGGIAGFAPEEIPVHIDGVETPVAVAPGQEAERTLRESMPESENAVEESMPDTHPAEVIDEDVPVG